MTPCTTRTRPSTSNATAPITGNTRTSRWLTRSPKARLPSTRVSPDDGQGGGQTHREGGDQCQTEAHAAEREGADEHDHRRGGGDHPTGGGQEHEPPLGQGGDTLGELVAVASRTVVVAVASRTVVVAVAVAAVVVVAAMAMVVVPQQRGPRRRIV